MKVLIVDDSPLMRKLIGRALRKSGLELAEVCEAGDGAEALDRLRAVGDVGVVFDLVMCDINMPVMDGLTMLEEMRKGDLASHVPVVMVTTEGTEQHVLRAIAAGAQGYICKPFTAEQLKSRVLPLLTRVGA